MKRLSPCVILWIVAPQLILASEPLEHVGVIPAPRADVWKALTTKEGIESWMVPKGDIDLRVGGKMRTTYDPNGTLGDDSTIENTILSFEPQRMFAIKATKPPATFPFKEAIAPTWSVMYLEDEGKNQTRLRIVGLGYGEDEQSKKMREFFLAGNVWTINKLKEKFAKTNAKPSKTDPSTPDKTSETERDDRAWELISRLAGGEWIHESTGEDGAVFRVRNVISRGASNLSLVGRSWLGNDEGMHSHGNSQVWRDPGTGHVRFQDLNESGGIAAGRIALHDQSTVIWDWKVHTKADKHLAFQVNMIFDGMENYRMQLYRMSNDGELTQLNNIEFKKVKESPARFRKLK